jgi:hypothetical protein
MALSPLVSSAKDILLFAQLNLKPVIAKHRLHRRSRVTNSRG